ncbi:MAG: ribosome maturation factor RimP [Actinomycetota bacterium]|jgi:ribosome maturation factor RimP
MSQEQRLRDLVEPLLAPQGLELVDLEINAKLVRVTVDRPGGIDLDTISDVTQLVSSLLDANDPFPGSYALEVSSPGLERPLRTPEHFRRFQGSTVSVKTRPDVEGERRVEGVLADVDDSGFTVRVGDAKGEAVSRRLSFADVEKARTVFEWGPPTKPGKVGSRPAKKKAKT